MDTLCIHLFGRLSIQRDGSKVFESLPPKAQELLVYLLLHRERWHTRERLAAELWPEASPADARSRLRRLMWRLQAGLGEDPAATHLLKVDGDWLGVDCDTGLWLDVAVVEQAYRRLGTLTGPALPATLVAELEAATGGIHGDLLDGWYQEWCLVERERLRIIQVSILSRLVNHYVASGEIERGVTVALQLLQIDPAHEQAHRQLMRLRYMDGDRTGALRQFTLCKQVLALEFGVLPERSTLALYDHIRREDSGTVSDAELPPAFPPSAIALQGSIEALGTRLDRLQRLVTESHDRVAREFQALHATLRANPTEDRRHKRRVR